MMPFNPHELRKLLKRYGVEVEELRGVDRVEFYMGLKKIVVNLPQVIVFKMANQVVYQVIGTEISEEQLTTMKEQEIQVSEDDVKFVMQYAGVSRDKAVEALIKARGDIAKAIMILRGEEKG